MRLYWKHRSSLWLYCLKVSRTEATSFLCREPLNTGWKWPGFNPTPEAIFDPFCWDPKNVAALSDHIMLLYVFRGSVWYRICSI
jgi:hypothetical protein